MHRNRCALLLADAKGRPLDKKAYEEFRKLVERSSSVVLPEWDDYPWFVYFDSKGVAQTVRGGDVKNPHEGLAKALRVLLERHPAFRALTSSPGLRPNLRGDIFSLWAYGLPVTLFIVSFILVSFTWKHVG